MEFKLGHVYDVTDFYNKVGGQNNTFAKYMICEDVWDFHIFRIVIGFNSEYEEEERTKLIEQSDIHKDYVLDWLEEDDDVDFEFNKDIRCFPNDVITSETDWFKKVCEAVIDCDTYDNDDLKEYRYDTPIEELIDDIDGGYGITVLDEDLNVKK